MTDPPLDRFNTLGDHLDAERLARREFTTPDETNGPRRAWVRLVAAGAVVAVGVGVAYVVIDNANTPSTVEAGWTATPQLTPPADIESIVEACTSTLSAGLGSSGPFILDEVGAVLAVDVRGAGGIVVFDSGFSCNAVRVNGTFDVIGSSISQSNALDDVADDITASCNVAVLEAFAGEADNPSYAWGTIDDGIDRLTIDTDLGNVEAKIDGRIWIAWWPTSSTFDQRITTFDRSGQASTPASFNQLFECAAQSLDQPGTDVQPDP